MKKRLELTKVLVLIKVIDYNTGHSRSEPLGVYSHQDKLISDFPLVKDYLNSLSECETSFPFSDNGNKYIVYNMFIDELLHKDLLV